MEDSTSSEIDDSSPLISLPGLAKYLSPGRKSDAEATKSEYTYGSMAESERRNSTSLLDVPANADLGNILEDEELHDPVTTVNEEVGESGYFDSDSDSDETLDASSSHLSSESFHLGSSTRMSARNIMVHERRTESFLEHGEDYELVNSQLKNNVRFVEDVNLIDDAKGRLYLAKYSFFKNCHDLKFAMTVQPDVYEKIMKEVSDSFNIPCDLYFCCHGGDGAHTGVSHNDYVSIKLAWFFFAVTIGALMAVEFLVEDEPTD